MRNLQKKSISYHRPAIFRWIRAMKLSKGNLGGVLRVCRESGYFVSEIEGRGSIQVHRRLDLGERLMANVKRKWQNSVMGVDLNRMGWSEHNQSVMDLNEVALAKKCETINTHLVGRRPFEIAENYFVRPRPSSGDDVNQDGELVSVTLDESCRLSTTVFTSPVMRNETFISTQRQRKIWWMKMFANPGRLFTSEIRMKCNVKHTSLYSQYPFGKIEIERFECIEMESPPLGRDLSIAIRSTMCLGTATVGTLLDAIDASVDNEICLDRTIAPYQCTVLGLSHSQDPEVVRELALLKKYIHLLIERTGISMLIDLEPDIIPSDTILTENICNIDAIGVPYLLIVNENSLLEGMLTLRNRDTTLSETIHLSDVPGYLQQIFGISNTESKL